MRTTRVIFPLIYLFFLSFGVSKATILNKIESRIVGGTNATKSQFPFYAQIVSTMKLNESSTGSANCGGSVISSTYILTAAHCVQNATLVRIILGFYTVDDTRGATGHTIKSVHIHDQYNATAKLHDIAIIELSKEIKFTDFVKPIQLSCNYTVSDISTLIAGTGLTNDVDGKLSSSLQWTNLTTISNERCTKLFSSIASIKSSNLCGIGGPKQGACHGDSGTALIREINGMQIQIGVVSWGLLHGCERGFPNVFTRISSYTDWIKQITSVSCVDE